MLIVKVYLPYVVQAYDGNPKTATVTTDPGGLNMIVTYSGSPTPPSAVGSYAVVATENDPNYQGSASGTLVFQPSADLSLSNLDSADPVIPGAGPDLHAEGDQPGAKHSPNNQDRGYARFEHHLCLLQSAQGLDLLGNCTRGDLHGSQPGQRQHHGQCDSQENHRPIKHIRVKLLYPSYMKPEALYHFYGAGHTARSRDTPVRRKSASLYGKRPISSRGTAS
jgi:hypothetical protein